MWRLANFNPDNTENIPLEFKAQDIVNLVWSFAALNHQRQPIVEYFTQYIIYICSNNEGNKYDESSIAKCFKRQEIVKIALSCIILSQSPIELMTLLYAGLFGVKETDPKTLASIYDDDGLPQEAIMAMLYVQTILDCEALFRLSLPPNFPSDWREANDSDTCRSLLNKENEKLRMLTSPLQWRVNEALKRCEDEFQEHIITTADVQLKIDKTLSDENQNFLSIGSANVDYGFEVNGPGHFMTLLDDGADGGYIIDVAGNQIHSVFDNDIFPTSKDESDCYSKMINGPTVLKDRLLDHLECFVMHIPYWEWRDLGGDEKSEEDYLIGFLIGSGIS